EIEVFVVGIVIGVGHLYESDAVFEKPASQQAMPAELVAAVAVADVSRLAADVEDGPLPHDLGRLIVGARIGFGVRGTPALGKALIDPGADGVSLQVGLLGQGGWPKQIGGRIAVRQSDRREARAEESGILAIESA